MSIVTKALKRVLNAEPALRTVAFATGKTYTQVKRILERINKLDTEFTGTETALTQISSLIGVKKDLAIVQVGANDGKTDDPIFSMVHNYATRALLIEPQPWLIDELRTNYQGYKGLLDIENIAISHSPGNLDFYVLRREFWPEYIHNVGRHPSAIFSPDLYQLLHRIAPRLHMSDEQARNAIDKISVPAKKLEDVMIYHKITDADIVQIDCEGWDFEVIKSLGSIRPPIINFESFNLSDSIWSEFRTWAFDNSYGYIRGSQDTLAIRSFPRHIED